MASFAFPLGEKYAGRECGNGGPGTGGGDRKDDLPYAAAQMDPDPVHGCERGAPERKRTEFPGAGLLSRDGRNGRQNESGTEHTVLSGERPRVADAAQSLQGQRYQ